ncbi:MAG: hypothetical protein IT381_05450 [Deltaproteobacteria bacterium]|nr:hypothetical protein [Deltaproteobacteria bacterium]
MNTLLLLALITAGDGLATDKDYKLVSDGTSAKVKAGAQGTLVLSVLALNGFKVSQETPFTVKLAPTAGLKLAAEQFARKDLVDPKAKDPQVKTTFTASAKGAQTVKADVVFFLCTDKLCQRMTAKTDVAITVE